jgi:hypothetical protein
MITFRAVLLAATALVVVNGAALAQTASTETWTFGGTAPVAVSATNTGAVGMTGAVGVTAPVTGPTPTGVSIAAGSTLGRISIAAIGAAASASGTLVVEAGATPAGSVLYPSGLTATATNSGAVTATGADILGGTISGGIANGISGSAVGASASQSLTVVVTGTTSGESPTGSAPTTAITFGSSSLATEAVMLSATNSGAISYQGDLGSTGPLTTAAAVIGTGIGNTISIAGVGASSSLSVTNVVMGGADGNMNIQFDNSTTVATTPAVTITAVNQAGGAVGVTSNAYGPSIGATGPNTVSHSISISGVGASASLSVTNVTSGGGTTPTTTYDFGSLGIAATNLANVVVTSTAGLVSPVITAPTSAVTVGNQISLASLGATASLSVTSVATSGSTDGQDFVTSGMSGAVTSQSTAVSVVADNQGSVQLVGGAITDPTINGAGTVVSNSISSSAVGAAASLAVSKFVDGNGTSPITVITIGGGSSSDTLGLSVEAYNAGAVTHSGSIIGGSLPNITTGTLNQISLSGVGASGSISLTNIYVNDAGTANPPSGPSTNPVITVGGASTTNQILAANTGNVTVGTATGTGGAVTPGVIIGSAEISGGAGNGISAAAVGASASLSVTNGVFGGSQPGGEFNINTASLLASNETGSVSLYGSIQAPVISAGIGNSISVAGVGASASATMTNIVSGTGSVPAQTFDFGALSLTASNGAFTAAPVTVVGALLGGSSGEITGGTLNQVSLAAVGASASQSLANYNLDASASVQRITFADIVASAQNGSAVTLAPSLDSGGVPVVGTLLDAPTITAGTANSIAATAVGATASQSVTNVVTGGADPAGTTAVQFTGAIDLAATNGGAVTVAGIMSSPNILGGTANSISISAVGASASSSLTNVVQDLGTAPTQTITYSGTLTATATNDAAIGVTGGITGGTISAGTLNAISVAAVGAAASQSFASYNAGSSASAQTFTWASMPITLQATNSAGVTVAASSTGEVLTGAAITTGISNSISVAGVGASASQSVTNVVETSADPAGAVTFGAISATATNNLAGAVTVTGNLASPSIAGGVSNAVSVSAVGASASQSTTNVVSTNTTPNTAFSFGAVNVSATNAAPVSLTSNIGTTSGASGSITGGTLNNISLAGVGASSATSATSINTGGTGAVSAQTFNYAGIAATANNSGAVSVTANVYSASIGGGIGNSISASAVGASASTSFTAVVR